jgi:hypothetical protein
LNLDFAIALGRGILLFWSAWLSVVFGSNLCDALRHAGALPASWRFASGNFALITEVVGIYSFSTPLATALFGAVLLVQLVAALLFWRAFLDRHAAGTPLSSKPLQAFAVSLALFAGLLVADELFIVYERLPGLETTHLLVLCALLLSLVLCWMLGGGARSG